METKRKGPLRASGTDAMAAGIPVPAESPAEVAASARAPEPEPTPRQQAAGTPVPAESPAEFATMAPVPETEPPPRQQAADGAAPDEIARFTRKAFAALAESQAAMTRSLAAISDAMAGLTRSGIDIAARTATDALGVRTLSDAYRVNARFARISFDSWLDGSAKLSGLGIELAAEASRPILTQLGQNWLEAARFGR
jgi:phasin protein